MVESIMFIVSSVNRSFRIRHQKVQNILEPGLGIGQNENWSFVDRDIGSPTVQNTIVKN